MKIFIHDNRIFKEKELENLNKWLVSKGRQPVENPIFQDVPEDVGIKDFVDGLYNESIYLSRKEDERDELYKRLTEKYIHERYSIDKEIEILFEKQKNPKAEEEHNEYVKECKLKARLEVYGS